MAVTSVPLQTIGPADAAAMLIGMIEGGDWANGLLPGGGTFTELLQQWVNLLGGKANVRNMTRDAQVLYLVALIQRAQAA